MPPPRSYTSQLPVFSSADQPAASAEATGSWISSTFSNPARRAASDVAALCGSSKSAGTEITAREGTKPRCSFTSARSDFSTSAASSSGFLVTLAALKSSDCAVPIRRLNSLRVLSASFSRKRRALAPTVTPPRASKRTTEGVSVAPWLLRTSVTFSPSKTAAVELVVPRSMPT